MPRNSTPPAQTAASDPSAATPEDVGFLGNSQKSIPNAEFALTTGPHSPSAARQIVDARRAQLEGAEASLTNPDPKG